MKQGLKNVAQRMVNAELAFLETLKTMGNITEDQARNVFAKYRKARVVKLDAVQGTYTVKHGALLDKEVIQANC